MNDRFSATRVPVQHVSLASTRIISLCPFSFSSLLRVCCSTPRAGRSSPPSPLFETRRHVRVVSTDAVARRVKTCLVTNGPRETCWIDPSAPDLHCRTEDTSEDRLKSLAESVGSQTNKIKQTSCPLRRVLPLSLLSTTFSVRAPCFLSNSDPSQMFHGNVLDRDLRFVDGFG